MIDTRCPECGCTAVTPVHMIVSRLRLNDLDGAIDAGLLAADACVGCSAECTERLIAARDERRFALAARERFRAREVRLARRAAEREAARNARAPATTAAVTTPALPPAAAAALQRALARAKGPGQ